MQRSRYGGWCSAEMAPTAPASADALVQRDTIGDIHHQNEVLKMNLARESRVSKQAADMSQAGGGDLSKLQDQADMYLRKIDAERRAIEDLERKLLDTNRNIATQRSQMGGLNASKENQELIARQMKLLQKRLDNAQMNYNHALAQNKQLREEIDALRRQVRRTVVARASSSSAVGRWQSVSQSAQATGRHSGYRPGAGRGARSVSVTAPPASACDGARPLAASAALQLSCGASARASNASARSRGERERRRERRRAVAGVTIQNAAWFRSAPRERARLSSGRRPARRSGAREGARAHSSRAVVVVACTVRSPRLVGGASSPRAARADSPLSLSSTAGRCGCG